MVDPLTWLAGNGFVFGFQLDRGKDVMGPAKAGVAVSWWLSSAPIFELEATERRDICVESRTTPGFIKPWLEIDGSRNVSLTVVMTVSRTIS